MYGEMSEPRDTLESEDAEGDTKGLCVCVCVCGYMYCRRYSTER
jgi:hypothetical protein